MAEDRTSVVRVDARALTSYVNTNPNCYTYRFLQPLRDVSRISIARSSIPRSQVIVLVRVSDWMASGTGLASTNNFHQMAVRMETAIATTGPAKSSYVAVITNPAATVDLRVYDVFTRTATRTSDNAFKTYDVLICTGTVLTSTTTDWLITAEAETASTEITPSANSATLAVEIAPQPAVLRLQLNGNVGVTRIIQDYDNYGEIWRSYKVYYPGMIVDYDGAKYVCTVKHLSIVFATDLASAYWNTYTAPTNSKTTSAASGCFEVFYFGTDLQTVDCGVYIPTHIAQPTKVSSLQYINFEWLQPNGQPFIFPYTSRVRVTDVGSSTSYTFEREYASPCLHLEVVAKSFGY